MLILILRILAELKRMGNVLSGLEVMVEEEVLEDCPYFC